MYDICKRIIDILFSILMLIIVSPSVILISVLIKLESKGPILLKQKRIGKNGTPFNIYRFRTMRMEIDERLQRDYLRSAIAKDLDSTPLDIFASIKNDPRVTLIGKFLRKTSLDELPQLINILNGEMSLVGPRPAFYYEYNNYTEREKKRLNVKPGITGLWQIHGRSELTFKQMIDFDLEYIDRKSLILDLKILLITFIKVILAGQGAI